MFIDQSICLKYYFIVQMSPNKGHLHSTRLKWLPFRYNIKLVIIIDLFILY